MPYSLILFSIEFPDEETNSIPPSPSDVNLRKTKLTMIPKVSDRPSCLAKPYGGRYISFIDHSSKYFIIMTSLQCILNMI